MRIEPGEHAHPLRVRYSESDQMGMAYYANHLVWFEVGRTEWLRSRGCAYRTLEDEGVLLPVTEAFCRYRASARYDDALWILTRLGRLQRSRIRFDYRIVREDGLLLATGHTEHVFLSRGGRPVRAPGRLRRLLDSETGKPSNG